MPRSSRRAPARRPPSGRREPWLFERRAVSRAFPWPSSLDRPYLLRVTAQVPGVHASEMSEDELETLPVQLCGPLRVTSPSALTDPVKPSNGAANPSEQPVWVSAALMPTSDASQCIVTFQVPVKFGQVPALVPP